MVSRTSHLPHFFTVDVEEYFHVNAFERAISRDAWSSWPKRLDRCVPLLLDALDRHGARGTFFVLGWVAEHEPDIVHRIASAGHEIASHGYWHRRIPTLTPERFREDVRKSKQCLEDLVGRPVIGFRAPSFSIIPGTEWSFDVLIEEGFRYDSSLFPIRRRGYGYPSARRHPHLITRSAGSIAEFPLATMEVAGLTLPAAGGAYLRHLPSLLIHRAFAQASERGGGATFYVHPWELDPAQPAVPVSVLTRLRHYRGLAGMLDRVEHLLRRFPFTAIANILDDVLSGAGASPPVTIPRAAPEPA